MSAENSKDAVTQPDCWPEAQEQSSAEEQEADSLRATVHKYSFDAHNFTLSYMQVHMDSNICVCVRVSGTVSVSGKQQPFTAIDFQCMLHIAQPNLLINL